MRKSMLIASVLLASGCAHQTPHQAPHWGYVGAEGADHWGELDPKYAVCASGKNQSPIDLSGFIEADLKPFPIDYRSGGTEILNNGHTIQVNYAPGSTIAIDGHRFELKQYHFHAPSENHIDGKSYPMEAHLVHADADGNLAVIAVMFVEGRENASIAKAWSQIPMEAGTKVALAGQLDARDLLPRKRAYYRFNGSLTTPPCSEGVRWLVMKEPVSVSKAQIEAFEHVMHHPNNRPVQPVNARPVLR